MILRVELWCLVPRTWKNEDTNIVTQVKIVGGCFIVRQHLAIPGVSQVRQVPGTEM